MLSTVTAIFATVGLVMPGFVIAELSRAERATSGSRTDFELVLRALFYALFLHVIFSPWTASLVRRVDGGEDWTQHVGALLLYAVVVLIVSPTVFGLLLNRWLRGAEEHGNLRIRHALAGARDARDAFDYAFGKLDKEGRYVLIRRKSDNQLIAGTLGPDSWAGKAPEPHDLYIEEVRSLSQDGAVGPPLVPRHGLWVSADDLSSVFIIDPPR
jgi:hypothetical protein